MDPAAPGAFPIRDLSLAFSKLLLGIAFTAVIVLVWSRRVKPLPAASYILGALLIASPVLHPWYLAWLVPFPGLRPRVAWLWVGDSAPLLYVPLAGWHARGEWSEPGWVWALIALPALALHLLDRRARLTHRVCPLMEN